MDDKFLKPYDPSETESRIYKEWEESGYFNPDNLPNTKDRKPFTVVMPPPNANGNLHAGHALFITLEDLFIRFRRMQGYRALWIPGADHAGFETQVVYEKKLEKEGRSRFSMDSKDLYEEILAFTLENKKNMEGQVRALGASCDWSREKFTLDPDVVAEVQRTFVKMYEDGLVYRGKRTVNWCPKHQTSLSDIETESVEETTPFYTFKYGPFDIGTVRPETKFGDKYVVMHPDDARYAAWNHGDTLEVEWINGPIQATVIKDEAVEMDFGTGVMTITPWHSQIDFEIAKRHNLDMEQIIDWRGKLLPIAGDLEGMKIADARAKIVEKLESKGLLVSTDAAYKNVVKRCYKCSTMIEPQVKDQWFVSMKPLAEQALQAVDRKEVRFVPEHEEKVFRHWLENTVDWNISRQIVWGIPIPAWYCKQDSDAPSMGFHEEVVPQVFEGKTKTYRLRSQGSKVGDRVLFENTQTKKYFGYGIITKVEELAVRDIDYKDSSHFVTYESLEELIAAFEKRNPEKGPVTPERMAFLYEYEFHPFSESERSCGAVTAGLSAPRDCQACGGTNFVKETDTFDTWFSSGQWPLLTTGYPDGKDFDTYYPTDVLETGRDILFFWVARMIMFGLYLGKKVPFHTVYLHGLVNDANNKKMSKSKGNVINPLDLTDKFGTDALRMGLVVGNTPGTDLALREDKIKGYKNFANKLWNIARYILTETEGADLSASLTEADTVLRAELDDLIKDVTADLENYRIHLAAEKIYHYAWHRLADELIEDSKKVLAGEDQTAALSRRALLHSLFTDVLKVLHPFMPFVTEEIWKHTSPSEDLLIIAPWPSKGGVE